MRDFEKQLKNKIQKEIPNLAEIVPSLAIEVHRKGELKANFTIGKPYRYYDIASLTKVVFSATAWMRWVSQSDFDLQLQPFYFLPWWRNRRVTVAELMTHSAGMNWWQPYYKKMRGPNHFHQRWPQLKKYLVSRQPKKSRKALYSNLNLYLLGFVLEELKQKSLLEIWREIQTDLMLENSTFNIDNRLFYGKQEYAPTTLQGEVHDPTAWNMGGIAPHAGLFASIHDVSKWGLTLRKALRGESTAFGSPEVVRQFVKRQIPRSKGDWGYLFMQKSAQDSACGRRFSKSSFGHNGFTGTSFWMDPVQDLSVVILGNRTNPTHENLAFAKLRPKIHDWICELL
jgi:CubicO group peptidase (beta-lactamase class C family)